MATMERFNSFLREVRVESRKVTWPSWNELRGSTIVVLVTVAIISMFIFVVDRIVGLAVTKIL